MSSKLAAVAKWIDGVSDPQQLCEAMWIHESFRDLDMILVDSILASDDFHARAAAIHTITNEIERLPQAKEYLAKASADPHPRVRLEAARGISFLDSPDAIARDAADAMTDVASDTGDASTGCVADLSTLTWGYGAELTRGQDGRVVLAVGT